MNLFSYMFFFIPAFISTKIHKSLHKNKLLIDIISNYFIYLLFINTISAFFYETLYQKQFNLNFVKNYDYLALSLILSIFLPIFVKLININIRKK